MMYDSDSEDEIVIVPGGTAAHKGIDGIATQEKSGKETESERREAERESAREMQRKKVQKQRSWEAEQAALRQKARLEMKRKGVCLYDVSV